jgi:hypothetical protein
MLAIRVNRATIGEPLWIEESGHEPREAILSLYSQILEAIQTKESRNIEYVTPEGIHLVTVTGGHEAAALYECAEIDEVFRE